MRGTPSAAAFCFLACAWLTGCDLPKDPEGTTNRILETHVLRVGATANPPWVSFEGDTVRGSDTERVLRFAAQLHARAEWTRGSESVLLEKLKKRQLDLVVGGFPADSPWSDTLGTSATYARERVIFTAPGENQLLLRLDRFLAHDSTGKHS